MLRALLNSESSEQVLIFILVRDEGYATEIASFFNRDLSPIQKQLEKLELGNILYSKKAGRDVRGNHYEIDPGNDTK